MGAGRRMKRKQGLPPSFEELQRSKQQKPNGQQSQPRGLKRSAPAEFLNGKGTKRQNNGKGNKRQNNGNRSGRPIREVYMSGALGVRKIQETPAKLSSEVAKTNAIPRAAEPMKQTNGAEASSEDDEEDEEDDDDEEIASLVEASLSGEEDGGMNEDEFGSSVFDSEEEKDPSRKRETMFSEDEDESDAEEVLTAANIAGLSAKLDAQQAADADASRQELQDSAIQTNLSTDIPRILPSTDEALSDEDVDPTAAPKLTLAPDLQLLRTRISDTIRVLEDFATLAEPGRNRTEYRNQLLKDVCAYYTYSPYLAEKFLNLFSPRDAFSFFEANESPRPLVIRTNTLKTHRRELAQSLIQRGATVEPVGKWSKVGLQIFESPVPIGATPEYLAGHYILQASTSFLPVMALSPQEHERILDMASAPGGKVTHIAALMKNTGTIFANDSNKVRSKALIGNIHRLGAKNVIVCNYDARQFPKVMGGFDRVLLDAPCSGTGVISKDPSVKTNKTPKDFLALPHLQKQLLLCAIDSVDHTSATGGVIVYSTCSVTVEENEEVVQYALKKRPNVRIADTGLGSFGSIGFTAYMGKTFDPDMKLCRRYYPHTNNMDGFFVCKLQKTGPSPHGTQDQKHGEPVSATENGHSSGDADDMLVDTEDDFGGWNDEEDQALIEKAMKRAARKKGQDVRERKQNGTATAATNGATNGVTNGPGKKTKQQ